MKPLKYSLAVATILGVTSLSAEKFEKPAEPKELSPWLKTMEVHGQFKLWYQTMDHGGLPNDKGFFQYDKAHANEWGNVEASISLSGKVNDHLKHKMTLMTVSTLGLDGHLVAKETARPGVFGSANGESPQPFWLHEAFLDYVFTENTDVKFGRMELNTPLVYTEKWNASANSFEALVATNTDIKDTTLVGAWVAKGNGATSNLLYAPQVFGAESKYSNFMGYVANDLNASNDATTTDKQLSAGGALAVGIVNKSVLPVQAWVYHAPNTAQAFWLQADKKIENVGPFKEASVQLVGASIGLQGSVADHVDTLGDVQETTGFAGKVGAKVDNYSLYGAVSSIGNGNLPIANLGTNFKKTKIPTASIFSDGMVAAQPDTTAWKVGGVAKFNGIGNLMVSYAGYSVGENKGYANPNIVNTEGTKSLGGPASMGAIAQRLEKDIDLQEFDVKFTTKVKDVNLAAMYIYTSKSYVPGGTYGEESNSIIRVVANLKF